MAIAYSSAKGCFAMLFPPSFRREEDEEWGGDPPNAFHVQGSKHPAPNVELVPPAPPLQLYLAKTVGRLTT